MTKSEIIKFINQKQRIFLNSSNTSYSSINKSKAVWWLNIAVDKFDQDVHLLLSDKNFVLWLYLPKGFVKQLSATFKIRQDKNAVDLEISSDKNFMYLKDVKSGGTSFNFTPFVREKIDY